jgi:outer membrane protein TolC
MNKPHFFMVIILLPLTTLTVVAEVPFPSHEEKISIAPTPDLSLSDVIDSAFQHAPQIIELQPYTDLSSALREKSQAWFAEAPRIALNYQTESLHKDSGYREYEAGIELPLWRLSQKKAFRSLAAESEAYAKLFPSLVRLEVASRVRQSTWEVIESLSQVKLAKKELEAAQHLEKRILRWVELGDRPTTDALLSTQEMLDKQAAWHASEAKLEESAQHYNHLTGLNKMPANLNEALSLTTINDQHPSLKAASLLVKKAKAKLLLERKSGSGQPSFSLNLRQEQSEEGTTDLDSFGIGFSLPIGTHKHSTAKIREAAKEVASAQTAVLQLRHQLEANQDTARIELKRVNKSIDIAQQRLEITHKSSRLVKIAYESGESSLIDLLRSQSAEFAAERENNRLQIARGRAISAINQSLGIMP